MMRVALTGATGFVGWHLLQALKERVLDGFQVACVLQDLLGVLLNRLCDHRSDRLRMTDGPPPRPILLLFERDGATWYELGPPLPNTSHFADMRLPIQYALTYPERMANPQLPRLDWENIKELSFEPPHRRHIAPLDKCLPFSPLQWLA